MEEPGSFLTTHLDILFIILSLLSVEDLVRAKLVCRSWFNLIQNLTFLRAHCSRPFPITAFFTSNRNFPEIEVLNPFMRRRNSPIVSGVFWRINTRLPRLARSFLWRRIVELGLKEFVCRLVHTCSKKEDMITRCFCQHIKDVKPKPFDHRDIYQQIEIIPHKGNFTAKSAAYDGFPPWIFRQKYWALYENNTEKYQLLEAFGLNNAIRSNFLKLHLASNVLIGKWYCPFIFVKESQELKNQMERTTFYEVTVEQFWQEAYSGIEKKRVLLRGQETMTEEMEPSDGFAWFRKTADSEEERIGLSLALWERIEWEENREGWNEGASAMVQEVKVGCFVLVERFSFKRLDGSVALALDFVHTDKVRTK